MCIYTNLDTECSMKFTEIGSIVAENLCRQDLQDGKMDGQSGHYMLPLQEHKNNSLTLAPLKGSGI